MNRHLNRILILGRKPDSHQFSIEKIFDMLISEFENLSFSIDRLPLPYSNKGWQNKVRNNLWVKRQHGPLHISGDAYYSVFLQNRPFSATIHDIGSYLRSKGLKKFLLGWIWFRYPAKKAKKLVFISEESRREFLQHFPMDEKRTTVIYNPLPRNFIQVSHIFNEEKPVILQIGTKQNKNVERLAEALRGISCRLVIVGILNQDQKEVLEDNDIECLQMSGLSDEQIRQAYMDCDLVSLVSIHEGFGMPIIEAQAIGRPVITSKISSMPEVAGDGACLVDPYNIDEIREGILKIIQDETYRSKLIRKGLENVKRFDPKKIASQYAEVFKESFEQT